MKELISNILKFVLFTLIGLGILYWVYQGQNESFCAGQSADCSLLTKIAADFRSINYFWILMMLAAFTISNIVRAYRWEMLMHPLGYYPRTRNTYLAIMLAYFANLAVSRVGEVVRCTVLTKYEKIPTNRLFGTVVVDRLLDVVCLLICIVITFIIEFDKLWNFFSEKADMSKITALLQSPILWGVAVVGTLGLVFLYQKRDKYRHLNFYDKIREMILGFWEGMKSIKQLERGWLFVFYSILIWVMYYLMTYFCFKSFHATANLPAGAALTAFVFGSLGIVIPSPGGMGSFHFLAVIALGLYGINGGDAFSFANIQFAAVNICIIFFGLMAVIALPFMNSNYTPAMPNNPIIPEPIAE